MPSVPGAWCQVLHSQRACQRNVRRPARTLAAELINTVTTARLSRASQQLLGPGHVLATRERREARAVLPCRGGQQHEGQQQPHHAAPTNRRRRRSARQRCGQHRLTQRLRSLPRCPGNAGVHRVVQGAVTPAAAAAWASSPTVAAARCVVSRSRLLSTTRSHDEVRDSAKQEARDHRKVHVGASRAVRNVPCNHIHTLHT